ncbi:MAG TPA: SRPBCC domain-containing protein, partial [Spirochaetia bacterium]|nr:SRPBCC domain-containing protein [Spirochaetia bacterium]
MNISPTVLRASIEVGLDPDETFAIVVGDLRTALGLRGVRWDEGVGSLVTQGAFTVARIVAWEPGRRIACEWHQASWAAGDSEEVELRFDGSPGGTTIVLEHRSRHPWRGGEAELAGWFASAVAAPLIYELTPQGLGSWITDRKARRPS